MESLPLASGVDNEDKSQKSIVRACDLCRKKKIRCELVGEDCAQCIKNNGHCTFAPLKTKKEPRRPPGYKHVEVLEKRLERMEVLLHGQHSIQVINDGVERECQTGLENHGRKRKASLPPSDISAMSRRNMEIKSQDHSPTFVVSPISVERISKSFQDARVPLENHIHLSVPYWNLTATSDVFASRVFKQLPPKSDALLLLQEMLNSHNAAFPIFDQESFMHTFEASYANGVRDDSSWWVCLNVVLALAHRFRAMRTQNSLSEDLHAWGYLQNALTVVTKLIILEPELLALQAILGVAIVLQGTPNSKPCSVLISTAMKMAQTMKLHRQDRGSGLSTTEIEQRKRVFWIAYIIDKDISLRTGDPPAQDDDDMDVQLPAETTELNPLGFGGVNFNLRIGLAIIQGRIYKSLLTTKSLRLPGKERLLAAEELETVIDSWKQSAFLELSSDGSSVALGPSSFAALLDTVILKFTYFHALSTINGTIRPHVDLQNESTDLITQPKSPDTSLLSDATCLKEARESMQLLLKLPQGDYACIWALLDKIFIACTTILSHVISNSAYTLGDEDMKLVEPILKLLEKLEGTEKNSDVRKMEESFRDLWEQAKDPVGNAIRHKDKSSRFGQEPGNGIYNLKEQISSVKEFIGRIELGAECWKEENWIQGPKHSSV